ASRILLFGVGRKVEFDLKQRIFKHLLTLEPAYFSQNTIGDLIRQGQAHLRTCYHTLAIRKYINK
ncbi:hypothetical protein, partial [Moorena sp. SIO4E2]|uniref:hypothetical protein n=1 Tax=Moorena sp. SIO4E2 TaxID=2607826 RepID=UPI00257B0B4C